MTIVATKENECGNNISTFVLKDDNGGRAGRKPFQTTDSNHWLETANSIPLSTNTYVKVNLTQNVINSGNAAEKQIGAFVVMKKDYATSFEIPRIENIRKKDIVKGAGFPTGLYVEEMIGKKYSLRANRPLITVCINNIKSNVMR